MQIKELKENFEDLENENKEQLIQHIHKLLMNNKKQENKILKLQHEIRYYERHIKKTVDLLNKITNKTGNEEEIWNQKN